MEVFCANDCSAELFNSVDCLNTGSSLRWWKDADFMENAYSAYSAPYSTLSPSKLKLACDTCAQHAQSLTCTTCETETHNDSICMQGAKMGNCVVKERCV